MRHSALYSLIEGTPESETQRSFYDLFDEFPLLVLYVVRANNRSDRTSNEIEIEVIQYYSKW